MRGFLVAVALIASSACADAVLAQDYGRAYNSRDDRPDWRGAEFFQEPGDPTVWYLYGSRRLCGVQNEQQLRLFGGFRQVEAVRRLAAVGRQTGACPWPDGFYRRNSEETVFRLSGSRGNNRNAWGNQICGVTSQEQMRRIGWGAPVTIVPDNADLQAGRGRWSPCRG